MIGVGVGIFLFKLAQRFDAVVRDDHNIRIFIRMLQDGAEHFVEGDILIREGILANAVDAGVVSHIEWRDGVKPMARAVFAGLREEREIRRMGCEQVIKELGLLISNGLYFAQPIINYLS